MTRKDYELIAGALREALQYAISDEEKQGVEYAAEHLSRHLKQTNPRFDADRFIEAAITK